MKVKVANKKKTCSHIIEVGDHRTKLSRRDKTKCGLRYKDQVWRPMAFWFGAKNKCKRCYIDGEPDA